MSEKPISIMDDKFIASIVEEINKMDELKRAKLLNAFILEVIEYSLLNAYEKIGLMEVLKANYMNICIYNEVLAQMKGN